MTTSIITVAQAEALAVKAALRLGVPVSVWGDADTDSRQAAVEAASEDVYAEPGLQVHCRETDSAVQLAAAIQAVYLLDLQNDSGAQERRRLQDQGVSDIQHGRIREQYRSSSRGLCRAARELLRSYRGTVYLS